MRSQPPTSATRTIPPEIPADAVRATSISPHPDVGLELGSYRVLDVLGEGGMGLVYLAEHMRLGRKVAIKRLKDRLAARPDSVKQFFEEARAVNRINHPHIVDITDFVVQENAAYYLMEYLDGETLADLLRREGPLAPPRAVHIVAQVCGALQAAHDAGFVHLDIKPSNIFLVDQQGDPDTVKILDFGTAQLTQTLPRAAESNLRRSAVFSLGTPVYMSPEQASGEEVDSRSDIYSLGAVIFEILTGQPPFSAQSAPEYIYKHMTVPAPRISQIKGLPHKIPRHCARAVMACLQKDPQDRPASMSDLSHMLLRGATATHGRAGSGPMVAERVSSGGRWILLGGVVAALVAAMAGSLLLFGQDQAGKERLSPAGIVVAAGLGDMALENQAARPTHVVLLLKTTPALARIDLLEPERRPLGMTPLVIKPKRTSQAWKVVITAEGHKPRTLTLVPDRDRTIDIALEKLPELPEEVLRQQEMGVQRDKRPRRAKGKMGSTRRSRLGKQSKTKGAKKRTGPSSMKLRRKLDSVRTINPFD